MRRSRAASEPEFGCAGEEESDHRHGRLVLPAIDCGGRQVTGCGDAGASGGPRAVMGNACGL